ncbi:MAG: BMP family ABC transporter substrate-binding protein [Fusobacteriaceae bacterium]
MEFSSPAEDEQFLREYAEKVSKEFPNTKFLIINDIIEKNIKSIVFKEEEGSF